MDYMNEINSKIMLFVKFGEERHIRRLFGGRIFFSNATKFRGIEKKTGLKGQGDAFEGFIQFKNSYAAMTDHCADLSIGYPDITITLGLADVQNIPIFCITCISADDCEIYQRNGKLIIAASRALKNTITTHFPKADTVGVFFEPQRFLDSFNTLGITFHSRVKYFDFSPNGSIKEMIEYIAQKPGNISKQNRLLFPMCIEIDGKICKYLSITEQNMKRVLLCKDRYFLGEKEYRIILPQKRIFASKEYTIRWGKQKRKMCTIDEFFNGIELL